MKNKYLFIPADVTVPCSFVEIEDPDPNAAAGDNKFNHTVHELISADLYEIVWIYSDLVMLVDDVGKLIGKPINPRASRFYRGTAYGDPIVGDVLICGVHDVQTNYDGEIITERNFGPLNVVYAALLGDLLDVPIPEPA